MADEHETIRKRPLTTKQFLAIQHNLPLLVEKFLPALEYLYAQPIKSYPWHLQFIFSPPSRVLEKQKDALQTINASIRKDIKLLEQSM